MVIDNKRRIVAIERAMRDVIIPAIDPKMGNAVEQAGYIVGHLKLMVEHSDWEYPFELHELRSFLKLAGELGAIAGGSAETEAAIEAAERYAAIALPPLSTIKAHVLRLREACDTLLDGALDGPADIQAAASTTVVAFARRQEAAEAAWLQGQGYGRIDGGPATIADALATAD